MYANDGSRAGKLPDLRHVFENVMENTSDTREALKMPPPCQGSFHLQRENNLPWDINQFQVDPEPWVLSPEAKNSVHITLKKKMNTTKSA